MSNHLARPPPLPNLRQRTLLLPLIVSAFPQHGV